MAHPSGTPADDPTVPFATAVPGAPPSAETPAVGGHERTSFDGVVKATPYRTNPWGSLDGLGQNLETEEEREKLRNNVRRGADLASEFPAFPETRRMRDKAALVFYWLFAIGLGVAAWYFRPFQNLKPGQEDSKDMTEVWDILKWSIGFAYGAAFLCAVLFTLLSNYCPATTVWVCVLGGPVFKIAVAAYIWHQTKMLYGPGILALTGVLMLAYIFCCIKPMIPFTIKLLENISGVAKRKPGLLVVSFVSASFGLVWYVATVWTLFGWIDNMSAEERHEMATGFGKYGIGCLFVFTLVFGTQVAWNLAHVTYCGVFGRWYYGIDGTGSLMPSLGVSLFYSFGSVCFGSAVVAFIRMLEYIAREARGDSDNLVCVIIGSILICLLEWLGDIVEYFNEWAFIQCAVRGVGFIEAVRITWSMLTCANVQYILSDICMGWVINFGTLVSGLLCAFAAWIGNHIVHQSKSSDDSDELLYFCFMMTGIFLGFFIGAVWVGAALSVLSSGAKCVLALWAEDPTPLQRHNPQLHDDFEARCMTGCSSSS